MELRIDVQVSSTSSEGTSIGYKYITLNNDAISYFQNTALGWNWFGVGMIEYEGNDDDCDIYGYFNSSYKLSDSFENI